MTADIELLPLPEATFETGSLHDLFTVAQMKGYARANVARAVEKWMESVDRAFDDIRELRHEVAAKDAEIETLRESIRSLCNIYVVDDYYSWELREERLRRAVETVTAATRHLKKPGIL